MSPSRARLRSVAGLGVSALVAASLTLVGGGSAQAVEAPAATLTWLVSDYMHVAPPANQFTGPVVGGGATADETTGAVTFVDGEGRTDLKTHETTVTYAGSAKFSSSHGGDSAYSVTFTDPMVEIDEDGDGTLSADIAWTAQGMDPGSADDVELTTFSDASWSGFELSATPDWVGVVEDDSTMFVEGSNTKTVTNGETWAPEFVSALPPSIRSFFYATTTPTPSASDEKKAPAPFTALVPGPKLTVTGSTMTPADVGFTVAGSGFTAVTAGGPPLDDGVYVGLAPSGGLPDVSTPDGQAGFAASAWVSAASIVDGSFTTALHAEPADLTEGTPYSLYTWKAHSQAADPDGTQTTETPVTIDWTALKPAASSVTVGGAASTTYGKAAVVTATVPAAGTVTLTGLGAPQSQTLTGAGTASFTVPTTLAAGTYSATLAYGGNESFLASQATKAFSVAKVASKTIVKVAPKPTAKKAGKAKVTVRGAAAGSKVALVIKGAGKTVKKTVKVNAKGVATVPLAKAKKGGSFKVTAKYAGDANHAASTGKATYKVAKPKKAKNL